MNSACKYILGVVLGLMTLGASCVHAEPRWSIKGFGTLGATGTDSDRIGFRRDATQRNGVTRSWRMDTDSRLGLQLDLDLSDSLYAGAQWIARNHVGDFAEQNLDWAYLRWQPAGDWTLRVGRLGFDAFQLSDYRNVGYTYPWIRPPHEFYAQILPFHFDGGDIVKKFSLGNGVLAAKAFAGFMYAELPRFGDPVSVYETELAAAGGSLAYETGFWRMRVGYAYSEIASDEFYAAQISALSDPSLNALWPGVSGLAQHFRLKNSSSQYGSIGLAYDDGLWLAQVEGGYFDSSSHFAPSMATAYFSVGRRIQSVTLYTLLGMAETLEYRTNLPPLLVPIPALVQARNAMDAALNNNGVDEKSISLGARWDIYENIALKAQWTHFWLGQDGTQLWIEPASGSTPGSVNVFSLGVDFIF